MFISKQQLPISIANYKVQLLLGQGCQAKIYFSYDEYERRPLCIKVYEDQYHQSYHRQKKALSMINHQNIIKIRGSNQKALVVYPNNVCKIKPVLFLQFAYYGDLFSLISHKQGLSEGTAKYIFIQILGALKQLEKVQICHRDIKLENILLDSQFKVKFIDFGFSSNLKEKIDESNKTKNFGTEYTKAPQIYKSQYYCQKIDMFACAVVFFCLLFGRTPFESAKFSNQQYKLIRSERQEEFWKQHITKNRKKKSKLFQNSQFKQLFARLFHQQNTLRPSIDQLLKNEWIFSDVATEQQAIIQLKQAFNQTLVDQKLNNYRFIDKIILRQNQNQDQTQIISQMQEEI